MAKIAYLSMIIAIIVIPVRMSRRSTERGPRRAVSLYVIACVGYYFGLAYVIPRLG